MSGYTENRVKQGVPEAAIAHLQKPFTLEGLAEKAAETLRAESGHLNKRSREKVNTDSGAITQPPSFFGAS